MLFACVAVRVVVLVGCACRDGGLSWWSTVTERKRKSRKSEHDVINSWNRHNRHIATLGCTVGFVSGHGSGISSACLSAWLTSSTCLVSHYLSLVSLKLLISVEAGGLF